MEYGNENPYAGYDPNFKYEEVMAKLQQLQHRIASTVSDYTESNGEFTERQTQIEQDIDSINLSVTEIDNRLETAETSISLNKDEIELRATKTSLDDLTGRVEVAEGSITANADDITLMVRKTDYTGESLISMINLTPDTIKISSGNIDLTGAVYISSMGLDLQEYIDSIDQMAQEATDDISELSDDLKVTAVEKITMRRNWDEIKAEYEGLSNQAIMLSLSYNSYMTAYTNLDGVAPKIEADIMASMSTTYTFSSASARDSFNTKIRTYFTEAETLRKLIAQTINDTAGTANTNANTAINRYNAWKYGATTFIDGGQIYTGTINLKGVNVYDSSGVNTLSIDSNGNLSMKGTLNGATGTFTGTISSAGSNQSVQVTSGGINFYKDNFWGSFVGKIVPSPTGPFIGMLISSDFGVKLGEGYGALQIDFPNFKVDSSGNLNLGTNSRASLTAGSLNVQGIEMNGNTLWAGNVYDNNNRVLTSVPSEYIYDYRSGNFHTYGGLNCTGINATNMGLNGTIRAHDLICAGTFTNTSDATLKTDIKEFTEDSIEVLKSTTIYEYFLKADIEDDILNDKQVGVLAQVSHPLIKGRDNASVKLYPMISILWKVCQDQQEIIENLQTRVSDLELFA